MKTIKKFLRFLNRKHIFMAIFSFALAIHCLAFAFLYAKTNNFVAGTFSILCGVFLFRTYDRIRAVYYQ